MREEALALINRLFFTLPIFRNPLILFKLFIEEEKRNFFSMLTFSLFALQPIVDLKAKIEELEINSKINNIRDLQYIGALMTSRRGTSLKLL
jgi:hypothetical protein